jgi:peptide/nickel transport system substrate-binding protein
MTPNRTAVTAVVAVTALATVLTGCGSDGGGGEPVKGGTFTEILGSDPGSLDPQLSAGSALFDISKLAYDTLVSVDADGEVRSQLATEWEVDGLTATLKIQDGITCGDGTPFTAQSAADNLNWISDPANQSGFLGAFLPVGVTSTAEGDTVTMTLSSPSPFLLLGLSGLPMVCDTSLNDRDGLAAGTDGTGPYVLTEAVPNDHYTYELREDYAWGPGGATVDEEGIPAKVNVRVVSDGTTAANLLLSGEANAARRRPRDRREPLPARGHRDRRRAVVQPRRGAPDERPGRATGAHPGGRLRRARERHDRGQGRTGHGPRRRRADRLHVRRDLRIAP